MVLYYFVHINDFYLRSKKTHMEMLQRSQVRGQVGEMKYISVKGIWHLLRGICKYRKFLGEKFPVAHSDLNFDELGEI